MEPLIIAPPENVEMPPLPEAVIEQLAELWCEAILSNLRRHPIQPEIRRAS
jgi:hypothetical protein